MAGVVQILFLLTIIPISFQVPTAFPISVKGILIQGAASMWTFQIPTYFSIWQILCRISLGLGLIGFGSKKLIQFI
ncbi:hypothetical protein CY35_17G034700 [Sphagnum magellanicum]|nr:hypothetical protein CY35_17G034700 [Sphagnum magellanicum]